MNKKIHKFSLVGLFVIASLLSIAVWYTRPVWQTNTITKAELAVAEALAGADIVSLGHAHIERLVALEKLLDKEYDAQALPGVNKTFWASLIEAGIDTRKQIKHLWFATYSKNKNGDVLIWANGNFDPAIVRKWMAQRYQVTRSDGDRVYFTWNDSETCKPVNEKLMVVDAHKIIVGSPERVDIILERIKSAATSSVNLQQWQAEYTKQVVTTAIFVPEHMGNPVGGLEGMVLSGIGKSMGGISDIYIGVSPQMLPPGIEISAKFTSDDQKFIDTFYQTLKKQSDEHIQASKTDWPELTKLYQRFALVQEGKLISTSLRFDTDFDDELKNLINAWFSNTFKLGGNNKNQAAKERINDTPLTFTDTKDINLDSFEHIKKLGFFKEQTTTGPFGLQIKELTIDDKNRLALTISAQSYNLPNIGKRSQTLKLQVNNVKDVNGQKLLIAPECGEDENLKPTIMDMPMIGTQYIDNKPVEVTSIAGDKKILLPIEFANRSIASIEGEIKYQIPTEIETVTLKAPFAGQVIERPDFRLRFGQGSATSLSYQYSGDTVKLLEVFALNAEGKTLEDGGGVSGDQWFGSGKSVSSDYYGQIAEVKVILAKKMVDKTFPFQLNTGLPILSDNNFGPEAPAVVDKVQWQAIDTSTPPQIVPEYHKPKYVQDVGPIQLHFLETEFNKNWGTSINLEAYVSNKLPIANVLSGGRIFIDELIFVDGTTKPANLAAYATFSPMGGMWFNDKFQSDEKEPWLKASAYIKDRSVKEEAVTSLVGRVVLAASSAVTEETMPAYVGAKWQNDALTVVLNSWDSNGISFKLSGNPTALYSIEAYDNEGKRVSHAAEWNNFFNEPVVKLELTDKPDVIRLLMVEEEISSSYPFKLTLTQP